MLAQDRKPYSVWEKLDYDMMLYDSDEEKKIQQDNIENKQQTEIVKMCSQYFQTYMECKKIHEATLVAISENVEKGLEAFRLFEIEYEKLKMN